MPTKAQRKKTQRKKNPAAVALGKLRAETMTSEAYAELGRIGGQKRATELSRQERKVIAAQGGKARAEKLTAEQRSEVARKAWATRRKRQAEGA
jgi:hypothetical protein